MNDDMADAVQDAVDEKYRHLLTDIVELEGIIEDQSETIERLEDRVVELEQVVDPDPEMSPDQLSKEQKVRKLRKSLIREAIDTDGIASMKYDEVRALFDMSIAPSYSYDLMDAAARMDGFEYDKAGSQNQGQKRLRVNMAAVNDKTLIHSVKKATQSNPA